MNTLKTKRLQRGLSQKQLSRLTNISQANISLFENNLSKSNKATQKKLEAILGKIDFLHAEKYKIKPVTKKEAW